MSRRVSAASCAAALLTLTLTGCVSLEDLDRYAQSVVTGVPMDSFDQVDRDAPFAGSPAEDYGEGFDVPEAEPAGSFTEEQVAQAYSLTQDLLEAVYLNQDAVFDGDNSEFTALLSGQALKWYLDNFDSEDFELSSRHVTFNITPGTAEPIGDVVKVDGAMYAEAARDEHGQDYLAVHTEYTIVHPVARPGEPVSVRLVTSHFGEVSLYDVGGEALEAWPNWWSSTGPVHCVEEYTLTPAYPDEFPEGEEPRGVPKDAYDREEFENQEECEAIGQT
ncbi:hypothetical protein A6A08_06775 [Nocardiopsis sp. TSRI0078]|uniref:hypothetical protein n=1 Tax=unclassified Nocardiopsis TaxID=2649073 RepID=UPI00093EFFE5|nr:hypothetical protein [Nocardiopsis sp. TSRI0078]OKI16970.1 hypothetical protein A6A08_06775 [Nocardiopsis sp. TSRI0078]